MSVIAWDGKTIAADKQATSADMRTTTTKIRRIASGEVVAFTGEHGAGERMAQWYEQGADPAKFPECQKDNDRWARLIIATKAGVRMYEREPVPIPIEDKFTAWGGGRDYAVGAMARGATAEEAVKITCQFCASCGMGVDVVRFE